MCLPLEVLCIFMIVFIFLMKHLVVKFKLPVVQKIVGSPPHWLYVQALSTLVLVKFSWLFSVFDETLILVAKLTLAVVQKHFSSSVMSGRLHCSLQPSLPIVITCRTLTKKICWPRRNLRYLFKVICSCRCKWVVLWRKSRIKFSRTFLCAFHLKSFVFHVFWWNI